jgi:hypothetical protein
VLRIEVALALVLALVAGACGDDAPSRPDAATDQEVATLRAIPSHELDVLFVIDDTDLDKQTFLKRNIGILHDMLAALDPPTYDVHIGVTTTDMGTTGSLDLLNPAPGIGSGPGSCAGLGKDGILLTNGTTFLPAGDLFVRERRDADGTITANYTATFDETMAALLSLGASGCGFEQPLRAMRRALTNPANAGFVRDTANLAVIFHGDEDDCSVRDAAFFSTANTLLGPLQSFRCTRWGLTCNEDINSVGRKTGCRPRSDSPYIEDVTPFIDALLALKGDSRKLSVNAMAGDPEPVEVTLRAPPGGGEPLLALTHSCAYNGSLGPEIADPGTRIQAFLDALPPGTSTSFNTICLEDTTVPLRTIATAIKKTLGDTCIDTRSLLDTDAAMPGLQPECTAVDIRDSDPSTELDVPFELVVDETICPWYPDHLRFVPHRTTEPASDTWTHVRCKLAP